jgi:CBS domain-containing protein
MQLKEVMTRAVETIQPNTGLRQAAKTMKEMDVGVLPVCDGDRLVGLVTDRDLTVRGLAEGSASSVADVMTPEVTFCFEDQDVTEAANLMEEHQIGRIPVLSREKRLVGIVSLGDLAVSTGDQALAGEVLERVSQPSGKQ